MANRVNVSKQIKKARRKGRRRLICALNACLDTNEVKLTKQSAIYRGMLEDEFLQKKAD